MKNESFSWLKPAGVKDSLGPIGPMVIDGLPLVLALGLVTLGR